MKLYIAASFTKRQEANDLKDILEEHNFIITSRWLNGKYSLYGNGNALDMEKYSVADLEDVTAAYAIVQITGDVGTKGGRHTELGFALAQGKAVFLLGPREQVFHYHPNVSAAQSTDELVALLIGYRRLENAI